MSGAATVWAFRVQALLIAISSRHAIMPGMRILVVDDDPKIAAALQRLLTYEGYTVSVASDGEAALAETLRVNPDLILLDLMLPKIDGLEVCRRMRAAGDQTPILMLTARSSVPDRVAGLDIGADDYLVKPFAQEELLARIRRLLRTSESNEILTHGPLRLDVEAMEVAVDGHNAQLTALEFRLLEYLMRNARIVLSRAQILDAVWGLDAFTTSNVVDVYVRYLRQKLPDAAHCIQTVRGAGYVLKES